MAFPMASLCGIFIGNAMCCHPSFHAWEQAHFQAYSGVIPSKRPGCRLPVPLGQPDGMMVCMQIHLGQPDVMDHHMMGCMQKTSIHWYSQDSVSACCTGTLMTGGAWSYIVLYCLSGRSSWQWQSCRPHCCRIDGQACRLSCWKQP